MMEQVILSVQSGRNFDKNEIILGGLFPCDAKPCAKPIDWPPKRFDTEFGK